MYRRKRILLLSSSIILLCACLIAGATFALFTDGRTVSTHLKAGDLDALLVRETGYYTVLNDQGIMTKHTVGEKDFTNDVTENFFGLDEENDLIVPQSAFEAIFRIENNGTVAFTYDVEITNSDTALAKQLYVEMGTAKRVETTDADGKVTVTYEYSEPTAEGYLNNGVFKLSDSVGTDEPVIVGGQSELMYARVTFVDDVDVEDDEFINNNVMDGEADFDLVVSAVQYTKVVEG
ncbi:MAG: hypothetical protein IJ011_08910 [Clostridia bacterium]|nr:hypothetical protein [Clostridia bacterium]